MDPQTTQNTTTSPQVTSSQVMPVAPVPPAPSVTPVSQPASMQMYAGFWRRVLAYLVTQACYFGIYAIIGSIALLLNFNPFIYMGLAVVLTVGMIIYIIRSESSPKRGAIGKQLVGLEVTDINGQTISIGRSAARFFSQILSFLIFSIGYIMAGFTEKKQALHDLIAQTLVYKTKPAQVGKIIGILVGSLLLCGAFTGLVLYKGFSLVEDCASGNAAGCQYEETLSDEEYIGATQDPEYLAEQLGLEGSYTVAGPAVIHLDGMWLKMYVIASPQIETSKDIGVKLTKVLDKNGKNILDLESSFETDEFFSDISLRKDDQPLLHFNGYRSIHLLNEARDSDMKEIEGTYEIDEYEDDVPVTRTYPFKIVVGEKRVETDY